MAIALVHPTKSEPDQQIITALKAMLKRAEVGDMHSLAVVFDNGSEVDSYMNIAASDEWPCYRVLSMLMGEMVDGDNGQVDLGNGIVLQGREGARVRAAARDDSPCGVLTR